MPLLFRRTAAALAALLIALAALVPVSPGPAYRDVPVLA